MEFEDLQQIWDTQNDRPVFSVEDSRLAVGLYQQREHARRRLFLRWFAPFYAVALFIAGFSSFLFVAFYFKTLYKTRLTDPQMSIWDGVALVAAAGAAVAILMPAYLERRKHERTQNVFAPSLREELERGISQLDFEASLHSVVRVRKMMVLMFFGIAVCMWELGRLNGDVTPWITLTYSLSSLPIVWYGAASEKKIVEGLMLRKRALESMLAVLKEDVARR